MNITISTDKNIRYIEEGAIKKGKGDILKVTTGPYTGLKFYAYKPADEEGLELIESETLFSIRKENKLSCTKECADYIVNLQKTISGKKLRSILECAIDKQNEYID